MKAFWFVVITMFSLSVSAQEKVEFEEIVKAIKEGQINDLSPFFANTVECDMFGKNNIYSKAQVTQVMKDFFNQNKPKQFKVNHQGGQGQVKFIIGTYQTIIGKKYRISCFIKQESGKKDQIQQIRIEDAADSKVDNM